MVTTRPPKTIVKPTALGPVANTDTKLLIYGLFQKGRVLAQDGLRNVLIEMGSSPRSSMYREAESKRLPEWRRIRSPTPVFDGKAEISFSNAPIIISY